MISRCGGGKRDTGLKILIYMDVYIDSILDQIKGKVVEFDGAMPRSVLLRAEKQISNNREERKVFLMNVDGTHVTQTVEGMEVPVVSVKIEYTRPSDEEIVALCARYGWKYLSHRYDENLQKTLVLVNYPKAYYGGRKIVEFESKEAAFDTMALLCVDSSETEDLRLKYHGSTADGDMPFYTIAEAECDKD